MPSPDKLEAKLWKALKSDMTVMLGFSGKDGSHMRPMTAQIEGEAEGPLWFFSATDTELSQGLGSGATDAHISFASKGHDLFACIHGTLAIDNDPAVIDRLWNAHVAAWYEEGRDDPRLTLLRFDPAEAEIWENASSLIAGIRAFFGADPKQDYRDKVAEVNLA